MTEEEQYESLVNQFRNGQDAKKLQSGLENILTMYKGELFNSLLDTEDGQTKERDDIYRQLKTIDYVESRIINAIHTGEMAKQELSAFDKAKQLLSNMIG